MQQNNKSNSKDTVKFSWTNSKLWWFFGWIFIFPMPLTTVLLKSKKINRKLAIFISIIAWVIYLGMWIADELALSV